MFHVPAESGVAGEPMLHDLRSKGAFRNLLVHNCGTVDDGTVQGIIQHQFGDPERSAAATRRYLGEGVQRLAMVFHSPVNSTLCRRDDPAQRGRFLSPPWALPLVLTLCLGALEASGQVPKPGEFTVRGKVVEAGEGVAGIEVFLRSPDSPAGDGGADAVRTVSGEDGSFSISVSAGSYLLIARGKNRYGFYGRNPVHASAPLEGLRLPLTPTPEITRTRAPEGEEHLAGTVLHNGLPVEGAAVLVYADASTGLRGPAAVVGPPTGPDGAFRLPLPPGRYFVAARYRPGGWSAGLLQAGDLYAVVPEMPLTVGPGEEVTARIELAEVPDREPTADPRQGLLSVTGRVLDAQGNPVPGMRACLYTGPNVMARPAFVSDPTGPDGRFRIEVARPGEYFLAARQNLGGPPLGGERVGFYGGPSGGWIRVVPGAPVDDLAIRLHPIP